MKLISCKSFFIQLFNYFPGLISIKVIENVINEFDRIRKSYWS